MASKPDETGTASLSKSDSKPEFLPVTVTKPIPYTFDLGNLLCNDYNPVSEKPTDAEIASVTRDCAQALINQLLTTCPISSHPIDGFSLRLPPSTTPLPREKLLPVPKPPTTWKKFAKKKGIKDKKRGEGKMVYEEATGEWVPKWGYKGRNKDGEGDWIVEVDERKEKKVEAMEGESTVRSEGRRERKEKVRRNERKQRANKRGAWKAGALS
ncbi:Rhodanese- sulfurtransferase [Xylographa opegraphella]|nr:Rhodanese- sulfurtransferase [Xylographa opegraphella]